MKKLLLLMALMGSLSVQSQNCFNSRTIWYEIKSFYDYETNKEESVKCTCSLTYQDDPYSPNDLKGWILYQNDTETASFGDAIATIETEGDKVYFKKKGDSKRYLMYDFGLLPREKALLYSIGGLDGNGNPYGAYMQCLEIVENNPEYDGLTTMRMRNWSENEDENNSNKTGFDSSVIWLKGVGSTLGVTENYRDYGWDGLSGSRLLRVMNEGIIIYNKENFNGIENVDPDTSKQSTDPSAPVYDLTGRVVGKQVDLNALPSGIYISNGKKVMK